MSVAVGLAPIAAESRAVLGRHGKSFRLAGRLLPEALLDDAAVLYAFCRLADDEVDEAQDPAEAAVAMRGLRRELRGEGPRPLVAAFLEMARRRGLPRRAAEHLLDGVESDLGRVRVADEAELLRYAYRVAGTVGLMMCGVLGARETAARPHAVDLGIGMQLSNIARDVAADAAMGRVYLPAAWLREAGVDPEQLLKTEADPAAVVRVVGRVLDLAEAYYRSADGGLRWLPWRSRWTVLAAGRLYRAIGRKVRRRGVAALRDRTVVAWPEKAWQLLVATALLFHPAVLGWTARPHDPRLHRALGGLVGEGSCTE